MENYTYCNDALLAAAFARSQKMMRFIDTKYNADKDKYYQLAKKNSRFKSRFITGNKIPIRMNAIKALGVIEAAKNDETLDKEMFDAVGRAFKSAYNSIKNLKDDGWETAPMEEVFLTRALIESGSDDMLHDTYAIYVYLCEKFDIKQNTQTMLYQQFVPVIQSKEQSHMKDFGDVGREFVKEMGAEQELKNLMNATIEVCGGRNIEEMGPEVGDDSEIAGVYMTMFDFAQLDNVPATMYEGEKFSKTELMEIFNTIYINYSKGLIPLEDINYYYVIGLYMRSLGRMYQEAEEAVEKYAGIVRENENFKKAVREVSSLKSRVADLENLVKERQEKLNALQLELDREKKKNMELSEAEALKDEQIKILQNILQENDSRPAAIEEDEATKAKKLELAKNLRAVVFGGHPNWQAELKKAAPDYNIVDADNYGFDAKIMDKADVVVIKTDYMAHAQWYKVIERSRKLKKRVVFFSGNNIEELLVKIGEDLL